MRSSLGSSRAIFRWLQRPEIRLYRLRQSNPSLPARWTKTGEYDEMSIYIYIDECPNCHKLYYVFAGSKPHQCQEHNRSKWSAWHLWSIALRSLESAREKLTSWVKRVMLGERQCENCHLVWNHYTGELLGGYGTSWCNMVHEIIRWVCFTRGCLFSVELPSYKDQPIDEKFFTDAQKLVDHLIEKKHLGFYPEIHRGIP